jgi:hypothetical protein
MEIERQVPTFSDTIVDLKKALEAEDDEISALRKGYRVIESIIELRDCSSWPAKYITVSRRWERWSGLREFELIGKTDYDLRPRKVADQITLLLKEVIAAGRSMTYLAPTGNAASGFKKVRFTLTPFTVGKKDFVVSIGAPERE